MNHMKPPYPENLGKVLRNICKREVIEKGYAKILEQDDQIEDFIRQRLERKLKWFNSEKPDCTIGDDESWQDMILRVMYKGNLGIEENRDGKVIYKKGSLLIIDWQSWCPVLVYCAHTGQRSVPVCSVLYHMQYQYLLSKILHGAFFTRDYSRIRPDSCCCREIIFYDSNFKI